eukprot:CAMPEP_0194366138 /NCGR_PEP_ID=MMETSP0174-20130528/14147_1 /TAXON_ID=216777 /ORGANISM="Proboscia alata, Strain PI-D3" /LENGTH=532 /DNA_ID=CAMNT_0039141147 /DNA_START=228 /DNA_END=1826 /DNA_ORIENTATION=+
MEGRRSVSSPKPSFFVNPPLPFASFPSSHTQASWDKSHTNSCQPTTYNGYPKQKTIYDDATLRMFNILIETSDAKTPSDATLGTDEGLLDVPQRSSKGLGHIPRNIRLGLLMIDLVEPYVLLHGTGGGSASDSDRISDAMPLEGDDCREQQTGTVLETPKSNDDKIRVTWSVGGAFTVDETFLMLVPWDELPLSFGCHTTDPQPDPEDVALLLERIRNGSIEGGNMTTTQSGFTSWHDRGYDDASFSVELDVAAWSKQNSAVFAVAKVDQGWSNRRNRQTVAPDVPPQSHIVNVRTNPDWHAESGGKEVRGRLYWVSSPVTLAVVDAPGNETDPTKVPTASPTKSPSTVPTDPPTPAVSTDTPTRGPESPTGSPTRTPTVTPTALNSQERTPLPTSVSPIRSPSVGSTLLPSIDIDINDKQEMFVSNPPTSMLVLELKNTTHEDMFKPSRSNSPTIAPFDKTTPVLIPSALTKETYPPSVSITLVDGDSGDTTNDTAVEGVLTYSEATRYSDALSSKGKLFLIISSVSSLCF